MELMEREINSRIGKMSAQVNLLYPLLKERTIARRVKTLLYTTILRPILTYGAETWKLTTKTESRIGAAEMRVLRIIYGVTRRDRIRNEVIRAELGVESVLELVQRGQLRWYGQMKTDCQNNCMNGNQKDEDRWGGQE
ncbi:uncharacterized protein LOC143027846 [Oratosquilla oratoria]|uniref:uncharacterized protein LOC143027846 n=1 Tax=Oratosquilla oratoria TaxID=337810 RepID=UPI003F7589C8